MKARYQYCFYPSKQQQRDLSKLFGCVRVVWNDALALCKASEKLPSANELQKICITQAKKREERSWLGEVSNIPLQQSIQDLGVALKNHFDSRTGKRKGFKMGFPKFKKKLNQQSARFRVGGFAIKSDEVYLAKIGNVKPIWSRELPSEPSSVTVIKDCANRYFLSFVVEIEPTYTETENQSVGIDLGIKTFATLSTGEKVNSPDYSRLDRQIRKLQKRLAKQVKGSNRWHQTRIRIARLYNRIADLRKDFLHKLSTRIVNENAMVILEDLNVSGMVKNRKLARAISLQGWRMFRDFCGAKSEKLGRSFQAISRWEPTSQICSECEYRWGKLDLSVREIVCLNCGTVHCRDQNASKNIEKVGIGHCHDSKRAQREGKTGLPAHPSEASRILAL